MVGIVMRGVVVVDIVFSGFVFMRLRVRSLMDVAVDLVDKESSACQHKPCVVQIPKTFKGLGGAPGLEDPLAQW